LSKGKHRFEARALDEQSQAGWQEINFAVDPTGRCTAVPEVRPRVERTEFC
jgi:hypothetical protein